MKTTRDELFVLLGFVPNRDLRLQILTEVKEKGTDVREVCSRYVLPEIVILESDGTTWSEKHQKYVTVAELEQEHPLGMFAKFVVIGTDTEIEAHSKLNNENN